jgi:hypothetical protein
VTKKQVVRKIIVMRKVMEEVHRVPYMRTQANLIAIDLGDFAKKHGLEYALVTRKF